MNHKRYGAANSAAPMPLWRQSQAAGRVHDGERVRFTAAGAEATKQMKPVHGRAAYYGEKCLGNPDGGAVVGQLIFEALSRYEAAHK